MNNLSFVKIAAVIVFFVGFLGFYENKIAAENKVSPGAESNFSSFDDGREIFDLINKHRRKSGLGNLQWSRDLESLARNYSRKMADGNFFSHYERNGDSLVQRAAKAKVRGWRKIGENLFKCDSYNKINTLAVEQWMRSSAHRQNILDQRFNTTGIGIAQSRDGTIYITQIFTQN